MPETEHVLREAPYLLTDTNRRGWGLRCSCGWRSPLLETSEDALAAGRQHVIEAEQAAPAGPKGFFARRRARKQQRAPWEERRRD